MLSLMGLWNQNSYDDYDRPTSVSQLWRRHHDVQYSWNNYSALMWAYKYYEMLFRSSIAKGDKGIWATPCVLTFSTHRLFILYSNNNCKNSYHRYAARSFHELHVCTIQSLRGIRLLLLTICINLLMAISTIWKFDGKRLGWLLYYQNLMNDNCFAVCHMYLKQYYHWMCMHQWNQELYNKQYTSYLKTLFFYCNDGLNLKLTLYWKLQSCSP